MAEEHLDANLGISRRTLIKRGAIVGGAVWAAPAITSFGSKAIGQTTGTPAETNISYVVFNAICTGTSGVFRVKVEEDGTCESGNTFTAPDCEGIADSQTASGTFNCAGVTSTVLPDGKFRITLPAGCTFTGDAGVKCGTGCDVQNPSGNSYDFEPCD